MKKPYGFLVDPGGNKSSNRLCYLGVHLFVALLLLYCVHERYVTANIRDICLGALGIATTGKVTQTYKELKKCKP